MLALVVLLVAAAVACRKIAGMTDGPFSEAIGLVRQMLYMGLAMAWAVSIRHRILHKSARLYLFCTAMLMLFWLAVRASKYTLLDGHVAALRYCWYGFYIPMLLIPLMAVFAACCMGTPESFRLPRRVKLLYIPTALLIGLILTNDLHRLAFTFPGGVLTYGENGSYAYGPVYFAVVAWIIAEVLAFFGVLWSKSRLPGKGRRILAPMLPTLAALAYGIGYAAEVMLGIDTGSDMTAVFCLLMMAVCETCIRSGLIQSNTRYAELFGASSVLARITDTGCKTYLASTGAKEYGAGTLERAALQPVISPEGARLSSAPIRGGRVFWEDDVSELLAVLARLQDNRETLANANLIAEANYRKERAVRALREKNRLYDKMQRMTAHELTASDRMLKAYMKADDEAEKRALLRKLYITGTFIKRKNNLVFLGEQNGGVTAQELERCFDESFRAIKLCGADGGFYLRVPERVSAETALAVYGFFESVVEASLGGLASLLYRVLTSGSELIACAEADCARLEEAALPNGAEVTREGDAVTLLLRIPLGESEAAK